jgi:hypothetical protein
MRKARGIDTINGAIEAFIDVQKPLPKPPTGAAMRKKDLVMWQAIMEMKSPDEWDDAQLQTAVGLAKLMADLKAWREQADNEPAVILINDKPTANPIFSMIERGVKQQLGVMRALHLVFPMDKAAVAQRAKARKAARDVVNEAGKASLLAS